MTKFITPLKGRVKPRPALIKTLKPLEVLIKMTKAVDELKVQVGRIAKEVKDAVEMLSHPESSDADVAAATEQLKAAADALEVATAPAEKKEEKAEAVEAPAVEAPVEAPVEAAAEVAVEAPAEEPKAE